jgi:hypothetical protein
MTRPRVLVPLTMAEFEFAMKAAFAAYDGKLTPEDFWSRPAVSIVDGDEVQDIYLNATPQICAMMAGGQTFGDDRARADSFRWRFLSLNWILQHKRFRDHIRDGIVDDALSAAIAGAPLTVRMTERQIIASVAAELARLEGAP